MSFPGDTELVERLILGDVKAFELIYYKYAERLYNFALKYLRSVSDAEELVQSVFVKIWQNRNEINKDLSFKSYIFTIAYNDICKIFRRRSYIKKFLADIIIQNPALSHEIDEGLEFKSILERVRQIINKMPERQKTIFMKSRNEGLTTKQIARDLNLSPGTVDNYISEAIKFLRLRLEKEDQF